MTDEARGASISYLSGTKNNWRRWAWNRISERCSGHPGDRLVIGLFGPDGKDTEEAVRRGFRHENLLAIERETPVIRMLRKRGITTIPCIASDVLWNWPSKTKVDVVYLDFCAGVGAELFGCMKSLMRPVFRDAAILINLQRGRDSITTFRDQMKAGMPEHWNDKDAMPPMVSPIFATDRARIVTMIRQGLVFQLLPPLPLCSAALAALPADALACLANLPEDELVAYFARLYQMRRYHLMTELLSADEPAYFSYSQRRVVMDSICYRNTQDDSTDGLEEELAATRDRGDKISLKIRRLLTAALAVRTGRRSRRSPQPCA